MGNKNSGRKSLNLVDYSQFYKIDKPEIAYLLGLIWADGNIYNKGRHHRVKIAMKSEDILTLEHIFISTGKWSRHKQKKDIGKELTIYMTTNRNIVDFLISNDYDKKKDVSADNILNLISDKLKSYWFLGLIDGDGCFYISKNKRTASLSITSSYNQNWSYMCKILDLMSIKYLVRRNILTHKEKPSRNSAIIIYKKSDIIKFGDYIYQTFTQDNIGLKRKYQKFLDIKNSFKKEIIKTSKYRGVYKIRNKFASCIKIGSKSKHLGVFKTEQEAYTAYKKECQNIGRFYIESPLS